jgi:hypothetical protein
MGAGVVQKGRLCLFFKIDSFCVQVLEKGEINQFLPQRKVNYSFVFIYKVTKYSKPKP